MSGPKVDYVELERQRQEALERERQEQLRLFRVAVENYHQKREQLQMRKERIKTACGNFLAKAEKYEELSWSVARVNDISAAYEKDVFEVLHTSIPSERGLIEEQTGKLAKLDEFCYGKYSELLAEEEGQLRKFLSEVAENDRMKELSQQIGRYEKKYTSFTNVLFGDDTEENVQHVSVETMQDMTELLDEVERELEELYASEDILAKDKEQLTEFAKTLSRCDGKNRKEVLKVIDEFKLLRTRVRKNVKEFRWMYDDYCTEVVAGIDMKYACLKSYTLKEKHYFRSVKELEEELERVQGAIKEEVQQNYIREQINAVMKELGYGVCEDIILRGSGKHYIVQKNKNTGIHVHISENDEIMMEIVGTENEQGDEENIGKATAIRKMSDSEKERLYNEQGQFCSIHPKIVKRLRERGVILRVNVHNEPDVTFCKTIRVVKSSTGKKVDKSRQSIVVEKLQAQRYME